MTTGPFPQLRCLLSSCVWQGVHVHPTKISVPPIYFLDSSQFLSIFTFCFTDWTYFTNLCFFLGIKTEEGRNILVKIIWRVLGYPKHSIKMYYSIKCHEKSRPQVSSLESLQSIKAFPTKPNWTPTPHSLSRKEDVLFPICLIRFC